MYNDSYNVQNARFQEKLRAFLEPVGVRIALVAILVVVFLILPIALGIHNAKYSATIHLTVAPLDARVLIDDRVVHPGDSVRVEPGEYTVVVKMAGFFSYAERVTLNDGDETTVLTALESSDESTADWYLEHPEDDSIASSIVSKQVEENAEEYLKEYPIVAELPIIEDFYRIDYGYCNETDDEFCILITSLGGARTTAANRLMGISGYDAAKYRIEYMQYVNPFRNVGVATNGEGRSIQDVDLSGARAVLDNLIAPFNADGYSFTVEGVEIADEANPSYALGRIVHHLADGSNNTYKVILQLRNDGWVMVAMPKLVYSYLDYPSLPKDVIFRANH